MNKILLILFFAFVTTFVIAQDILGGQIRVTEQQLFPPTYEIIVDLYTTVENHVLRPTISLDYGDGTSGIINLTSKDTVSINVIHSIYKTNHVYPGPGGSYGLFYTDSSWVQDIVNILDSCNIGFYLDLVIIPSTFPLATPNSSPYLNYPFSDITVSDSGNILIQNTVTRPDEDYILYLMDTFFHPCYQFPQSIDTVYMDLFSGDIVWNKPIEYGKYLLYLRYKDFRNNQMFSENFVTVIIDIDSVFLSSIQPYFPKHSNPIVVFPNPTKDHLNIQFDYHIPNNTQIQIFDMVGHLVYQQAMTQQREELNIGHLSHGMYVVRVVADGKIWTRKVIKN